MSLTQRFMVDPSPPEKKIENPQKDMNTNGEPKPKRTKSICFEQTCLDIIPLFCSPLAWLRRPTVSHITAIIFVGDSLSISIIIFLKHHHHCQLPSATHLLRR
ncbi:hypothetical protein Hanom_Chr11g01016241 [Helianthus anomalus]